MGKSTPSDKVPQWTKARYWQFLRSALRSAWTKYPVRYAVLQTNRKAATGQRHKWEYLCVECKNWFLQKDIQVDHIIPAGTLSNYDDLPAFTEKLFCSAEDLQIMCKPCHKLKTAEERKNNKGKLDI